MYDEIIRLVATVILLALFLFIGDKFLGKGKKKLTLGYFLVAALTAVIIIVLIIAAGVLVGILDQVLVGVGGISTILGFVLASYAVKFILVKEGYERSLWITMVAYALVYIVNAISYILFNVPIVQYI